jgi:predicted component of type VI protein secretion system
MKYQIDEAELNAICNKIDELRKLLDERVIELNDAKGYMQARHAFIYYRKILFDLSDKIKTSMKAIKKN